MHKPVQRFMAFSKSRAALKMGLVAGLSLLGATSVFLLSDSPCFGREWYGKCVDTGEIVTPYATYRIPAEFRRPENSARDAKLSWLSPQLAIDIRTGTPAGLRNPFEAGTVLFRISMKKEGDRQNDFSKFSTELKLEPHEYSLDYEPPKDMLMTGSAWLYSLVLPRKPDTVLQGPHFLAPNLTAPTLVVSCWSVGKRGATCSGMTHVEPGLQLGFNVLYSDLPQAVEIAEKLKTLVRSWSSSKQAQ